MRYIIFINLIICSQILSAQCSVTISQLCGHKDLTVFYKDGSLGAQGMKINDSSMVYTIPVVEPFYLYIMVDEASRYAERLWVDPKSPDRKIIINHCTNTMIRLDTIAIEMEDAPRVQMEQRLKKSQLDDESRDRMLDSFKKDFIIKNPSSFLSSWYLSHILTRTDIDTLVKLKNLLASVKPNNSIFKSIVSYVDNYKYKSVPKKGDLFYEFQAITDKGDSFLTRNLENKVILMDFWYSTCGPCLKSFEKLREIYSKYKSDYFSIISFSADDNEVQWKEASLNHHFEWASVSDLKGFYGPIPNHYNVDVFPYFILFNKEKRIVVTAYGIEDLPLIENTISEILKPK